MIQWPIIVSRPFPFIYSDVDQVSELSDVHSINSLDSYSSGDSDCTLEDLAFLEELKDCRIGVGQVARFRCQLLGRHAVTVSWHHGSKMIENGGRYRIYRHGSRHTLEIYFTTFADSGAVLCRAMGMDCMAETRARLRIRGMELFVVFLRRNFCGHSLTVYK